MIPTNNLYYVVDVNSGKVVFKIREVERGCYVKLPLKGDSAQKIIIDEIIGEFKHPKNTHLPSSN